MNPTKVIISLSFLLLALFTGFSQAASLETPEHLQVTAINGEKQSIQFMIRSRNYKLPEGLVSLKLKYRDLIESDDDDSHDTIKSDTIEIHFEANSQSSFPYVLVAERPDNTKDAYAFARKPLIQVTQNGKPVPLLQPTYTAKQPQSQSTRSQEATEADQERVETMLNHWWQKASDETRAAFLKKVGRNN